MEKPNVEKIEDFLGNSIDQKSTNRNPSQRSERSRRSRLFRLLYARMGCHIVQSVEKRSKTDGRSDGRSVVELPERTKIQLLAPVVRGRKGEHQKFFEQAKRSGYVRVVVDGNLYELSEDAVRE